MNTGQPRRLSKSVVDELSKTFGPQKQVIPSGFLSSKLYKDVLAALDVARIPAAVPLDRAEWLNVLNAWDGIICIVGLLGDLGRPTPAFVYNKIAASAIPRVWKWLQWLHPHAHNCDEEACDAAIEAYGWDFPHGEEGWLLKAVSAALITIDNSSQGRIVDVTDLATYIFDMWRIRNRDLGAHEPADERTGLLLDTLTRVTDTIQRDALAMTRVIGYGKDPLRTILRRMRAVVDMPLLNFREVYALVELAICVASIESTQYVLRPLLWLIAPLMRLADKPESVSFAAMIDRQDPGMGPHLRHYVDNCFHLLKLLRPQLRCTRDVIRLVESGILQAFFDHLQRYSDACGAHCIVGHALRAVMVPMFIFPSVANAVSKVISRHSLGPPAENSNKKAYCRALWTGFHLASNEIKHDREKFKATTSAIQYCHNVSCGNRDSGAKLKRCACGYAYYCCKTCQVADWSRHKAACRPVACASESQDFDIDHFADIYFIRYRANKILASLDVTKSGDDGQSLLVDFSEGSSTTVHYVPGSPNCCYAMVGHASEPAVLTILEFPNPVQ
ncbi:uncharacterized protein SCHCODRAFT_02692443 [Schizophyllum commune H4-8]|nr:uncharacterized protein SCHCODRAFT_02692443 [Schizophyllum commune H4-8]KAI5887839.1 hypothetical protein SCHCODRAFT_02692443 [Schizophyllum commune H4-8]